MYWSKMAFETFCGYNEKEQSILQNKEEPKRREWVVTNFDTGVIVVLVQLGVFATADKNPLAVQKRSRGDIGWY